MDLLDKMIAGATKKASPKKATKPAKKEAKKESGKGGRLTGEVVSYNDARGYGFIKVDDTDYFLHKSQLVASGITGLKSGDKISFVALGISAECKKGNCAVDVKLEKSKGGSMKGGNIISGADENMQELFHRLVSLPQGQLNNFADMANINPSGMMMGGGKSKLSKLALVNLLIS